MAHPLVKEPDPILHRKAQPVIRVTGEIRRLAETMVETMHAAQGVGLAANQIGSHWDVLVASPDGKRGAELILVNAVIIKRKGRSRSPEGCLSLPGISSDVTRAKRVTVSGLNLKGERMILKADGLLAKILQHEADHLRGHLFPDRLGVWRRRRLLRQYLEIASALRQVTV